MWTTGKPLLFHTTLFSGCIGTSLSAVLWLGRIHQMLETLPLIKAISIPVIAGCVTASVVYGVFVIHSWLPRVRWGRAYADRCVNTAKSLTTLDSKNKKELRNAMLEVEHLQLELSKYKIPCPPVLVHDSTSKELWREFLIVMGTRAKEYDLCRARKAIDDMNSDARQEWIDLGQSLEDQYS